METENDILELKFEGNGINPSIVKPSEIAAQIEQFEKALLSTIKQNNPTIDINEVLFTFESIKNESIELNFSPVKIKIPKEVKEAVVNSFIFISSCVSKGDFSLLPDDAIGALKFFSKFSRIHNCSANFRHNGNYLSTITPSTEIKYSKKAFLKGDINIYGTLNDTGGENPNIHLKVNDEYNLIIETNKETAKELALRLYDYIGLRGTAKWDAVTGEIVEFKLQNILDYRESNIKDAFSKLRNISSGGWDKYNSDAEINKRLFRD